MHCIDVMVYPDIYPTGSFWSPDLISVAFEYKINFAGNYQEV